MRHAQEMKGKDRPSGGRKGSEVISRDVSQMRGRITVTDGKVTESEHGSFYASGSASLMDDGTVDLGNGQTTS